MNEGDFLFRRSIEGRKRLTCARMIRVAKSAFRNTGSSSLCVRRSLIGCVTVNIHGHANKIRLGPRAGRAGSARRAGWRSLGDRVCLTFRAGGIHEFVKDH